MFLILERKMIAALLLKRMEKLSVQYGRGL